MVRTVHCSLSHRMSILTAFGLTLLACVCSGQLSAIATFNSRGIAGTITFEEILNTDNIRITASLQGLRGNHAWHVHTLPVDQTADPAYQCLSSVAGPHYDPFNANNDTDYTTRCSPSTPEMCEVGDLAGKFGPIPANGSLMETDSTGNLALRDRLSIVGRSIVIHSHLDGTNFECATIRFSDEQPGDVTTLQARFISPIAGTIYFRQVGNRDVVMWGKFFWVNDMGTTLDHNWHIHEMAPGEEYRVGMCTGNLGPHYDPLDRASNPNYETECTPETPESCEIGDLTGKHDTLTISANPSPFATNSFFFTDRNLSLADVGNRSVAIHAVNRGVPIVACAPLVASEDIVLYSYENGTRNVDFSVSQISPFENTVITNDFQNIYVLESALNPVTNCLAMGNVYSPFPSVDSSPDGELTPDRVVLGDFNQRYDFSVSASVSAFDVPIHSGNNTISGKSIRLISGEDRRVCNALLPSLDGMIIAKATFSADIGGAMYFIQQDFGSDQLGNTHIILDIYHSTETTTTTGHNWHVHQNPAPEVVSGVDRGEGCTAAIGGHYNPFDVSLANTNDEMMPSQFSNYSDDCTVRYNLRCESGDLSGKHGRLTISPVNDQFRPVVSFVDSNLALTGSYSIIGRSIGLHMPTGPLYDCGSITRVYISTTVVSMRLDADRQLRSEIVRTLTQGTNVHPTDVLVMSQSISELGFGFNCVNVSVRVLGSTPSEANTNAATLIPRAATIFDCNGSPVTVTRLSILLLVLCTLLGLSFY